MKAHGNLDEHHNSLLGDGFPITTLALVMLFWPLLSKALAAVRKPKVDEFAAQRPVD